MFGNIAQTYVLICICIMKVLATSIIDTKCIVNYLKTAYYIYILNRLIILQFTCRKNGSLLFTHELRLKIQFLNFWFSFAWSQFHINWMRKNRAIVLAIVVC